MAARQLNPASTSQAGACDAGGAAGGMDATPTRKRKRKRISAAQRSTVIAMRQVGNSFGGIARETGLAKSTVVTVWRTFEQEGTVNHVDQRGKQPRSTRFTADFRRFVGLLFFIVPNATIKLVRQLAAVAYPGQPASVSTIRALHLSASVPLASLCRRPVLHNHDRLLRKRAAFAMWHAAHAASTEVVFHSALSFSVPRFVRRRGRIEACPTADTGIRLHLMASAQRGAILVAVVPIQDGEDEAILEELRATMRAVRGGGAQSPWSLVVAEHMRTLGRMACSLRLQVQMLPGHSFFLNPAAACLDDILMHLQRAPAAAFTADHLVTAFRGVNAQFGVVRAAILKSVDACFPNTRRAFELVEPGPDTSAASASATTAAAATSAAATSAAATSAAATSAAATSAAATSAATTSAATTSAAATVALPGQLVQAHFDRSATFHRACARSMPIVDPCTAPTPQEVSEFVARGARHDASGLDAPDERLGMCPTTLAVYDAIAEWNAAAEAAATTATGAGSQSQSESHSDSEREVRGPSCDWFKFVELGALWQLCCMQPSNDAALRVFKLRSAAQSYASALGELGMAMPRGVVLFPEPMFSDLCRVAATASALKSSL